ncbi:hypothetical protein PLICRDRAFT_331059 [Plicaturopsis crispa FD-325 SS-3]|uniref:MYND-type domain-containing protein n=1 Tax=Plicaturopsis crispa FD-325 SS-3 TaxID=944288 RepID=A0A0C9T6Y7_PLICR|nr:hypothetical protein PLICRDRAFT_331059 [Plicaturopsis crispa FD-325 SS-3]
MAYPYGNGRRPKFVKFAPGDRGEGLLDAFYEDPRVFRGKPGKRGQIHAWGLYPHPDEDNLPEYDVMKTMQRMMATQMIYHKQDSPERQFINALKERKRKELAALDLEGRDKRDVIIRIYLVGVNDAQGNPRIWRRLRVSGGIKLSVIQDKVIAPVMGWVRNFHCYFFTQLSDGTMFGPKDSDAVDRFSWQNSIGYDWMPDDKYMLAQLYAKEGDQIGYLYDFGDKWFHEIEIEKIIPQEESDGHIEILDGKGMCPGENMHGSLQYNDFLKELDSASPAKKAEKKREILSCPNYKEFGKPPSLFNPDAFDITQATERLASALSSTNSVRSGAKIYTMPIAPTEEFNDHRSKGLKKGQTIMKNNVDEDHGYWQETVSGGSDKKKESVCASCGKPGGEALKVCGGCRQIMYCSPEHQKAHWTAVHKKQCTRNFLKK